MSVNWAALRKALVAVAGAAGSLLSLGLIPDPVGKYVAGALAVLTAFGVYRVPNQPQPIGNHQLK